MQEYGIRHLPVVCATRYVGLVDDRLLALALALPGSARDTRATQPVADVAAHYAPQISTDTPLAHTALLLSRCRCDALIVVDVAGSVAAARPDCRGAVRPLPLRDSPWRSTGQPSGRPHRRRSGAGLSLKAGRKSLHDRDLRRWRLRRARQTVRVPAGPASGQEAGIVMAHIIVGVDSSPSGRQALLWAVGQAVASDASLTAVRSWSPPVTAAGYGTVVYGALAEAVQDAEVAARTLAQDMLKDAVGAVSGADRLTTDVLVREGSAAAVLVAAAADADLLVVGTRGAGLLARSVLGSVSASVLHHAERPVAVVPATAAPGGGRIVVGVDHSPQSSAALQLAVALARQRGSALVPVYVHDPRLGTGGAGLSALEAAERASLDSAAQTAGAEGVVEPEVPTGHPVEELLRLSGPTDVLVLGSRGRGGFTGLLLGSVSAQCAQHATGPVVVVRSAA